MTSLQRRIKRLEQRTAAEEDGIRVVVLSAGSPNGEDPDRLHRALDKCGFAADGAVFLRPRDGGISLSDEDWDEFRHAYEAEPPSPSEPVRQR
jgi:hypothetical protein